MKKTCETCGNTHTSKETDVFKFSEELKTLGWKREKTNKWESQYSFQCPKCRGLK